MGASILAGDDGSRHAPVNIGRGATVTIPSIVSGRDPHSLPVSEAGCLGEGEASHEVGSFELKLSYRVRGQASSAQRQVGDLINPIHSAAGTHPAVSRTAEGHSPDHALLAPDLSESVGVDRISCPLATVRIKGSPGGGLDSETVGHEVRSFELWLL